MKRPVASRSQRAVPKSRINRILSRLLAATPNEWISAPELAEIGGIQLNARLWELRHKLKFDVENKVEVVNGEKHSWYRLRRGCTDSLFGDLLPDRTYAE